MDAKHEDTFTLRDWNDEDRMNFMFSAFPKDRNINPRHWDSKMNYWIEEIKRCCLFYGDVCINCEKLRERFSRKDRVPHGNLEKNIDLAFKFYQLHAISSLALYSKESLFSSNNKVSLNMSYAANIFHSCCNIYGTLNLIGYCISILLSFL